VRKHNFRLFLCHLKWCDSQTTSAAARGRVVLHPIASSATLATSRCARRSAGVVGASRSMGSMPVVGLLSHKLSTDAHALLGMSSRSGVISGVKLHPIGGTWPMWTGKERHYEASSQGTA